MSRAAAHEDYVTVSARTPREQKESAERVLKDLGVPMSTAINMFIKQIAIQQAIPFPVTLNTTPNKTTLAAMQEADDILSGKVPGHPQSTASFFDEMGD